jgi:hypothetical protein
LPPLPENADLLDVRPDLASGADPFSCIVEAWALLAPGRCLVVLAPFMPLPLIAHFSSRGVPARPLASGNEGHFAQIGPKP